MHAITTGSVELEARAYRVTRRLSSGVSASVFEVSSATRGRLAIKVLFSDDPAQRVRFLFEAAAQSRVEHENVTPMLELVRTPSGLPCIVMPLLVGRTLRDELRVMGRASTERAKALVSGALHGLEQAHRRGVVHRGVTPDNLFVGRGDRDSKRSVRAILLDFGLAQLDDAEVGIPPLTLSRLDPAYLPPEVLLGERVDPRADVYAMGVVLFELLTGRPPFVGADRLAVMEAHLDRTPPRLDVVAGQSRALADVVARALEKVPSRRWSSAAAFARALEQAVGL